jgi:hypothetical protein
MFRFLLDGEGTQKFLALSPYMIGLSGRPRGSVTSGKRGLGELSKNPLRFLSSAVSGTMGP